jgi:hypothetical protein
MILECVGHPTEGFFKLVFLCIVSVINFEKGRVRAMQTKQRGNRH